MRGNSKIGLLLILVPLVYGLAVSMLMIVVPPLPAQLVFGVFWFWVGMFFATLRQHPVRSFLLGNSLWTLSFALFAWQFLRTAGEERSMLLAGVSQFYLMPFIWLGIAIQRLLNPEILHGTHMMLAARMRACSWCSWPDSCTPRSGGDPPRRMQHSRRQFPVAVTRPGSPICHPGLLVIQ